MREIPTKKKMIQEMEMRTLQEKVIYLKHIKLNIIKKDLLNDSLYKNRVEWIDNKINIYSNTKSIIENDYGLNRFMD